MVNDIIKKPKNALYYKTEKKRNNIALQLEKEHDEYNRTQSKSLCDEVALINFYKTMATIKKKRAIQQLVEISKNGFIGFR
jgi:hypothetical protein